MNLEDMKELKAIRRAKKKLQYVIMTYLCDPCSTVYPGVETRLTELRNQLVELDELERIIVERNTEEYDEKINELANLHLGLGISAYNGDFASFYNAEQRISQLEEIMSRRHK